MAGLNRVQLIGRLGADPESKSFQNGGKVVNLRIATSETWKDKTTGERKEKTEWHSVAIFNENIGEIAEKYLRKGSQCYVEGKLQTRKWQDQSGADRYSTEIVLQGFDGRIVLLDSKRDGEREESGRQPGEGWGSGGSRSSAAPARPSSAFDADLDDDVPF